MLSNVVRELFPGAERDQHERSRAHWMLKQVTKSQGNCEALEFQEFLHLVRLRLDLSTEARLQEEHRALEVLKFVPVEAAEWRIIFHKLARAEQSATTGGVLTQA
ncbi:unnamed protein product [Durusdinium trenchii]|uniref:Uncharacterized protein n=1 Tax=Durusdinium trenchii TaxID=1381693 RepID=A0ABP0SR76_9DINO